MTTMTMGPDSFGNGSTAADERFTGPSANYRPGPSRRESSAVLPIHRPGDDLVTRNGGLASIDRMSSGLDSAPPIASSLAVPKLAEPALDELEPLIDRRFGTEAWLDSTSAASMGSMGSMGSMADHPLLRGLLLELPAKGTVPPQEWLDRWFEAARSILELLYSQD